MSNQINRNQKHLTLDDRIVIEKALDQKRSFRSIAAQLGKDPTTISKEIKKHLSFREHNHFNEPRNKCALFKDCKKRISVEFTLPSVKKCLRHLSPLTPIHGGIRDSFLCCFHT